MKSSSLMRHLSQLMSACGEPTGLWGCWGVQEGSLGGRVSQAARCLCEELCPACEHCRPGWPTPRRPDPNGFIVVSSALCVSLENFKFPELSDTELAVPVLLPLCSPWLSPWAAAALYPTKPRRGARENAAHPHCCAGTGSRTPNMESYLLLACGFLCPLAGLVCF